VVGGEALRAASARRAERARGERGGLRPRGAGLTLYLDTSGLVKLLVEEDGSEIAKRAAGEAELIAALLLTYVEARAALARMRADGRLSANDHGAAVAELDEVWATTARVPVEAGLVNRAATLADRHLLRAYDAMQLAGALEIGEEGQPHFACWDGDLRAAARDEGLPLVPE
jgi:predicted nucleic acid-binding protein